MPVPHRFRTAATVALALMAAAPAYAQQEPRQRRFQQQRHLQQQRLQQPLPQQRPQQPQPQEAQRRHKDNRGAIAAGVIGGLAAGALLGGVLSGHGGPAEPGYAGEEGGPGYGGGCPLVRRPVYDGAGQFAGYQTVPSC